MYRFWKGPVIGRVVSDAWSSYGGRLFFEFGRLTPGDFYLDRKGIRKQFSPSGEWSITSMDSWPAWTLYSQKRVVATSECCRNRRESSLRLLIGRRLCSFEIDPRSLSTRLKFSLGLSLETQTNLPRLRAVPHWLIRGPRHSENDWPTVILNSWSR